MITYNHKKNLQSFSNYPSLKVLEAHIGENMQNTLKIKDYNY